MGDRRQVAARQCQQPTSKPPRTTDGAHLAAWAAASLDLALACRWLRLVLLLVSSLALSFAFRLPSFVFRLSSFVFVFRFSFFVLRLPSSVFRLPSSAAVVCRLSPVPLVSSVSTLQGCVSGRSAQALQPIPAQRHRPNRVAAQTSDVLSRARQGERKPDRTRSEGHGTRCRSPCWHLPQLAGWSPRLGGQQRERRQRRIPRRQPSHPTCRPLHATARCCRTLQLVRFVLLLFPASPASLSGFPPRFGGASS